MVRRVAGVPPLLFFDRTAAVKKHRPAATDAGRSSCGFGGPKCRIGKLDREGSQRGEQRSEAPAARTSRVVEPARALTPEKVNSLLSVMRETKGTDLSNTSLARRAHGEYLGLA